MGRSRGRARRRIDKAFSPGASRGFTGANMTAQPKTYGLAEAINAATNGGWGIGQMRDMMRDPRDDVAFGPSNPLAPAPIDPLRPDTGRPEPRLTEYPVAWNLPGNSDRLTPWSTLRAAAASVDIMRRCISVRKEQLQGLEWAIGLDDAAVQGIIAAGDGSQGRVDVEADLRRSLLPEIKRLTEFWCNPWKANGLSFEQWVNGIMEDHLVLDAVAIYPRMTYGGDVSAFELIDATTIKLLIDYRGARPMPPYPAFQQVLYGFPRGEFASAARMETDEEGNVVELVEPGIPADQLWYFREEYRSFTPYGYSAVEQSLISARLYLKRQGWMLAEYDDGSTPLTWLVPDASDGSMAEKLTFRTRRQWEDSLNDELSGQTRARHRMKVAPPGMNPVQMAGVDERYKPDYDMHLIKMLAGHFGVTSSGLGFSESRGLGNSGLHEGQADVQDASTTKPDTKMIERIVNELSRTYLKMPEELRFKFVSQDVEDQAAEDVARNAQRARGTITLNDDRKAIGKTPFTFPEADMPMVLVGNAWVPLEGMAERAEQQAEQEAALVDSQLALTAQESAVDGEEVAEQDAEKALELSAYRRWARKRGGDARRPFICKALEPADWPGGDVPADVDFAEWAWVPDGLADDASDDMIVKHLKIDIEKGFGGGNDNWRTLARDHRGRWVKRGSMRIAPLGPSTPDKPVLAGLARDAQRRRGASQAVDVTAGSSAADKLRRAEVMYGTDRSKWPAKARQDAAKLERQLPVSDASSTMGGMTTPRSKPKAKRLPDAQHNAVQGIAERYAHNVATLDTTSVSPMVDATDLGIRPATADALVKAGILERQTLYGFQRRYRLTDAGHAYLAEHTGDARRAELSRVIADLEAQRETLNANRTAYDRDATNLAATVNRQTMQAEDQRDRMLMQQANALRDERAKLAVRKPDAAPPVPSREERAAALNASAAAMMSGGPAPKGSMAERIMNRQDQSVRDVVTSLQDAPGGWVAMADVRRKLADEHGMDRGQQDAALRRLATTGDRSLNTAPEDNQKTLTDADHAAAVDFGAGPQHVISLDPPRRSVLDTVRESSEQAAAVSAVIDSVPGLREGVARQQPQAFPRAPRNAKPKTEHRVTLPDGTVATRSSQHDYTHAVVTTRDNRAYARHLEAEAQRDAERGFVERAGWREQVAQLDAGPAVTHGAPAFSASLADARTAARKHTTPYQTTRVVSVDAPDGPVTVREEGRQNNPGFALPTTPPAARAEAIAASTPDVPKPAPTIESMMAQQMAGSTVAAPVYGAEHGKVTGDQVRKGTRVQFRGTAWTVDENPRKARPDSEGRTGVVFRATREDQGIQSTMRLNDGASIALAAPKDAKAARPKAEASAAPVASAEPLTRGAALAAAPKDVEASGARGVGRAGTAAIERYRGKAFTEINRELRAGAPSAANARTAQQIDAVMAESRLTAPVVVHRGVGNVQAVFGDASKRNLAGAEWTDATFQSTTTEADVADRFRISEEGSRTTARIVMRVPAGVGAVQLSDERYEAELLLQRGLRMRVVSDTGPWRRGQKNPRTIEVEVIPG